MGRAGDVVSDALADDDALRGTQGECSENLLESRIERRRADGLL